MKYIFILLLGSVLFTACDEGFFSQTVEIDPPPYEKHLSFHLRLSTGDSVVRVIMTRNYGILESIPSDEDWFVKGATAELYENGQKWLTLAPLSADSNFVLTGVLPHPLVPGNTYEIRAEHPAFPKLSAVQVVPSDFQVDSVRIRYNAVPSDFGGKANLLEVFLNDQPNVKNYYEVTLLGRQYNLVYDPLTGGYDTLGIQEFPLYVDGYNDPNVQEGMFAGGLISDQFFDGQPYKFQARFFGGIDGTVDSTLVIQVRNITPEYYQWSRSYLKQYNEDGNPLVEPVSVFNNLNNGLGIFSIANEKRFRFQ